jgi:hypothetical protein
MCIINMCYAIINLNKLDMVELNCGIVGIFRSKNKAISYLIDLMKDEYSSDNFNKLVDIWNSSQSLSLDMKETLFDKLFYQYINDTSFVIRELSFDDSNGDEIVTDPAIASVNAILNGDKEKAERIWALESKKTKSKAINYFNKFVKNI